MQKKSETRKQKGERESKEKERILDTCKMNSWLPGGVAGLGPRGLDLGPKAPERPGPRGQLGPGPQVTRAGGTRTGKWKIWMHWQNNFVATKSQIPPE